MSHLFLRRICHIRATIPSSATSSSLRLSSTMTSTINRDSSSPETERQNFFPSQDEILGKKRGEEAPKIIKVPVLDEFGRAYGTGRRKSSVARVWIKEGSGQFVVNDKLFSDYFQPIQREHALGAFVASKTAGLFDTFCTVKGGGISGQAGAVRLGVARALEAFNPQHRILLREGENMLTRDSRRVERKKPGQKKARKKFQWVKR